MNDVVFTPLSGLIGGMIIGLASVWLMALNGRIAGISGIIGRVLPWQPQESGWRLAFIAGLLFTPLIWQFFAPFPAFSLQQHNSLLIILAGLLVGFGTRLASGCTSGHGVCGLSRLSGRSLLATLTFMLSAVVTVFISQHLL